MEYVSNREIEYVVSKVEKDVFVLKHMLSNEQVMCSLSELVAKNDQVIALIKDYVSHVF